jgi:hypothetical protein
LSGVEYLIIENSVTFFLLKMWSFEFHYFICDLALLYFLPDIGIKILKFTFASF